MRRTLMFGIVLASVAAAAPALAHTPTGLVDLIGMRGAFIDREMSGRGYTLAKARGAQYWWSAASNTCAAVSTSNGRVAAITTVPNAECGHPAVARPPHGHASGLGGLAGMNSIMAIDAMSSRGFANVDSFTTGNTQYGIYYNRGTGVCAQLTMADSKVVDARDIHTHPKCH